MNAVLSVACPYCHAAPDHNCRRVRGKFKGKLVRWGKRLDFHDSRGEKYREEGK